MRELNGKTIVPYVQQYPVPRLTTRGRIVGSTNETIMESQSNGT